MYDHREIGDLPDLAAWNSFILEENEFIE